MLTDIEKEYPKDTAVLTALGQSLLAMKRPLDAAELFERVVQLGPDSAVNESNAGTAWMQAGQTDKAVYHLERAVNLDPLLLPAAEVLVQAYRQQGQTDKLELLGDRVRKALGISAPQASDPQKP
jgi:predicted Zn-dependent protease